MSIFNQTKKSLLGNLTFQIFIAMIFGALLGVFIHKNYSVEEAKHFSEIIKILATIFIRLVQMIIAPLVFSTLVVGIAKLGDIKSVGRIGGKALLWFFSASLISLLIGMFWVNLLQPGKELNLNKVDTSTAMEVTEKTNNFSIQNFVEHIIPKSIFEALSTNEILQIVIFSIFFGLATASIGKNSKSIVEALEKLSHIILKMVTYVMKFAPIGVFGAIASVFAIKNIDDLVLTYTKFFSSFLVGIATLWLILIIIGYIFLGKKMNLLFNRITSPLAIAFGTTSSEAVFPKLTEELEQFGIKNKIVAFMLPLGYSFNLDGSMMYMTFAVLFIAQAYGIDMPVADQLIMLFVLLFTSKGVAGVPRASLIVIAATLSMFNIPEAGLLLLLGIDQILDMGRSATNVFGNSMASALVSKWEKALR